MSNCDGHVSGRQPDVFVLATAFPTDFEHQRAIAVRPLGVDNTFDGTCFCHLLLFCMLVLVLVPLLLQVVVLLLLLQSLELALVCV